VETLEVSSIPAGTRCLQTLHIRRSTGSMVVRGGKSADLNTGKDVLSAILLADSFTQVGTYIHLSLDVRDYA